MSQPNPPPRPPAPSDAPEASDNPMESFIALMESQRDDMERQFGFWNASPPRGHWRVLLTLGAGSITDRPVAQVSWDNPTAQAMACRLAGLPGPELPFWASSEGLCSMMGLRLLMSASSQIEGGWAEAPGLRDDQRERLASETNTARGLWMGDADDESKGEEKVAGLMRAWAEATGGVFKVNHTKPDPGSDGWASLVGELMAPFDWSAFPQRSFAAMDPSLLRLTLLEPASDPASPPKPAVVLTDLRSAARALGCPPAMSLAAPEYKNALCWQRIQEELGRLNQADPIAFQRDFGHCLAPANGGLEILAARQEAYLISLSTGPGRESPASRPRV